MPSHITFLLRNALFGFVVAGVFVWLLVAAGALGMGHLAVLKEAGWWVYVLLFFFLGLTFASLMMGMAIWQLGRDQDGCMHTPTIREAEAQARRLKQQSSDRIS